MVLLLTPLLRMRAAAFVASDIAVGPLTLDVLPAARMARAFASGTHAKIAALMAAGIVKASSGSILIDQFDPRVQPAHCKRIAAFVAHEPLPFADAAEFERYVRYRAALWDVDPTRATAHAKLLLERMSDVHEAFAYPVVAALVSQPKLVVLDRPPAAYADALLDAVGPRALFSTHADEAAATAFQRAAALAIPS